MDDCTRQDPAYRPATERARSGGPFLCLRQRQPRAMRLASALTRTTFDFQRSFAVPFGLSPIPWPDLTITKRLLQPPLAGASRLETTSNPQAFRPLASLPAKRAWALAAVSPPRFSPRPIATGGDTPLAVERACLPA